MKIEFILNQKQIFNEEIVFNDIKFQVCNDKMKQLEACNLGDIIEVSFNIKGTDKERADGKGLECYNNLNVWKIESLGKKEE